MVYFMRLLFHASLICILATIFNMTYVLHFTYQDWSAWQWLLCTLNPAPFVLIGWLTPTQFFFCLLTSLCVVLGPAMGIFFVYHLRQLLHNRTSIEVLLSKAYNPSKEIGYEEHDMSTVNYDLGWRHNLEQVMGRRWVLGFLLPWLPVLRSTDGLNFPISTG